MNQIIVAPPPTVGRIYESPVMEMIETTESLQYVFCQASTGNGQSEKYNPNGDTSGWF